MFIKYISIGLYRLEELVNNYSTNVTESINVIGHKLTQMQSTIADTNQ